MTVAGEPSAAEFWEDRYRGSDRVWSGRANPVLVDVVTPLAPGRALDLGCGEGGDTVWLAGRGWHVTAVDISATALRRTAEHAAAAGVADRVVTERHELGVTFPSGEFELVSAQFLQSPVQFARDAVLRAAARAVAPGGLLLVVEHGAAPPWSWAHHHHEHEIVFPTPEENLAVLDLAPGAWDVERLGSPERLATGPDGQEGVLVDTVVAVRRR